MQCERIHRLHVLQIQYAVLVRWLLFHPAISWYMLVEFVFGLFVTEDQDKVLKSKRMVKEFLVPYLSMAQGREEAAYFS